MNMVSSEYPAFYVQDIFMILDILLNLQDKCSKLELFLNQELNKGFSIKNIKEWKYMHSPILPLKKAQKVEVHWN